MTPVSKLRRVALVIGVQDYRAKCFKNLDRVYDDVNAMVDMLIKKGGFVNATPCIDPDRKTLLEALRTFRDEIKQYDKDGGCMALLYYSGHGMMDSAANHYMLPKDWWQLDDISESLEEFACKLEGDTGALAKLKGAKAAIALFDCCRSFAPQNPNKGGPEEVEHGWKGCIAPVRTSEHNLLLCYACAPGAAAHEGHKHGHFTAAILETLCTAPVYEAISIINQQVYTHTRQQPHLQGCDLRPFSDLRLGLPGTSSATSVEGSSSAETTRSSCESQRFTVTGARNNGVEHQLRSQFGNEEAAASAIPYLVKILDSTDACAQEFALREVANLAAGPAELKAAIVEAGAIPCLRRLLGNSKEGVLNRMLSNKDGRKQPMQAHAARALADLADGTAAHVPAIVSADIIPLLVQLLRDGDDDLKGQAARGLANLAASTLDHQAVYALNQAIPALVQLLDSNVQTQAARGIANLAAGNVEHRAAIVSASAIPVLQRLLESKNEYLQLCAAQALANLANRHAKHRAAIMLAGAILVLVRLLESKDKDVQHHAAGTIAHLAAWNAEHRAAIVLAGAICPLVRLLESKVKDVQLCAARAIANLAAWNTDYRAAIVSAGAIAPLVRLLESKDASMQLGAARATANLAILNAKHRAAIMSAGAIVPLMRLLESEDASVQLCAARAIANLAAWSAKHRAAIMSAGAIPTLVRMLESKDKNVQRCAAWALADRAAGNADHAPAIVKAGAIPPLVRLLESMDEDVQEMATAALESFPFHTRAIVPDVPDDLYRELERKLHEMAVDPSQTHHLLMCPMCSDGTTHIQGAVFVCKDCPKPPGFGLCGSCMDKTESEPMKRLTKEHTADHRMVLHVTAVHFVKAARDQGMPDDGVTRLLESAVLGPARSVTAAASPSFSSLAPISQPPGSLDSTTTVSASFSLCPAAEAEVHVEEVVCPLELAVLGVRPGRNSNSKVGLSVTMVLSTFMVAVIAALAVVIAQYCKANRQEGG